MSGDRHNSNMELLAQGIANVAVPLVEVYQPPARSRVPPPISDPALAPVSGMVRFNFCLSFTMHHGAFYPAGHVGSYLFVVAGMSGGSKNNPQTVKADAIVWVMTFGLTVLADLTVAVEIGMLFCCTLHLPGLANDYCGSGDGGYIEDGRPHVLQDKRCLHMFWCCAFMVHFCSGQRKSCPRLPSMSSRFRLW